MIFVLARIRTLDWLEMSHSALELMIFWLLSALVGEVPDHSLIWKFSASIWALTSYSGLTEWSLKLPCSWKLVKIIVTDWLWALLWTKYLLKACRGSFMPSFIRSTWSEEAVARPKKAVEEEALTTTTTTTSKLKVVRWGWSRFENLGQVYSGGKSERLALGKLFDFILLLHTLAIFPRKALQAS